MHCRRGQEKVASKALIDASGLDPARATATELKFAGRNLKETIELLARGRRVGQRGAVQDG